ncbi:hypothetical protein Hdeb2414_s0011g00370591 [Helianthus debilis subsp. tardiflorus]
MPKFAVLISANSTKWPEICRYTCSNNVFLDGNAPPSHLSVSHFSWITTCPRHPLIWFIMDQNFPWVIKYEALTNVRSLIH